MNGLNTYEPLEPLGLGKKTYHAPLACAARRCRKFLVRTHKLAYTRRNPFLFFIEKRCSRCS